MPFQITGFWIPFAELCNWWTTHSLSRPWDGTPGTIAVGLEDYLQEHAGLKCRLSCMNRKVKVDYLDITQEKRPGKSPEIFLPRRFKWGTGHNEVFRDSDAAFAEKLRQVGLNKFVFASVEVADEDRPSLNTEILLYDSGSPCCITAHVPSTL